MTCVDLTSNEHHCNRCEKTYQHKRSLDRHIQIEPKTLARHFEAHFKTPNNNPPISAILSNPPKKITDELRKLSEDFPIDNTIPREHEVRKVIRKLNGNKNHPMLTEKRSERHAKMKHFFNMFIIQ